jgi:excisionase family DNA binding protein
VEIGRASQASPWLTKLIRKAKADNDVLRQNGASAQAEAREAILREVVAAERLYADELITVSQAATDRGVCEETIRRAIRKGQIPAERRRSIGHRRIRRRDLAAVQAVNRGIYCIEEDALEIAACNGVR